MGPVFIEIPLDVQASVVDCKIFDKDCNNKFEHNFHGTQILGKRGMRTWHR